MLKTNNKNISVNQRLYQRKISGSGFTLIELLVVIGIAVILLGIVIVAINPAEKLLDARNNQRKAHVEAIYGAIEHYRFQEGSFPDCVGETSSDAINCDTDLVPIYMAEIPKDPVCGNGDTKYLVKKDALDRAGVSADCAEGEEITAGTW